MRERTKKIICLIIIIASISFILIYSKANDNSNNEINKEIKPIFIQKQSYHLEDDKNEKDKYWQIILKQSRDLRNALRSKVKDFNRFEKGMKYLTLRKVVIVEDGESLEKNITILQVRVKFPNGKSKFIWQERGGDFAVNFEGGATITENSIHKAILQRIYSSEY